MNELIQTSHTSITVGSSTITGALILAAGANITLTPSGQTITISATGGGMSYPLLAPNGSVGAPSYAFSSDPTTGIYYDGSLNLAVAGVDQAYFSGNELQIVAGVDFIIDEGTPVSPTATSGFIYLPISSGGAPTGVPAQGHNGAGATFFDPTASILYIYNGTAWKSVALS